MEDLEGFFSDNRDVYFLSLLSLISARQGMATDVYSQIKIGSVLLCFVCFSLFLLVSGCNFQFICRFLFSWAARREQ